MVLKIQGEGRFSDSPYKNSFVLKLFFFLLLYFLYTPLLSKAGEYVISPGDTISILVWGHSEYTQTIPVRPDGKISYPFLGEAKVDGMTTTELAEKIKTELLKYLLDPQVSVMITQANKLVFSAHYCINCLYNV